MPRRRAGLKPGLYKTARLRRRALHGKTEDAAAFDAPLDARGKPDELKPMAQRFGLGMREENRSLTAVRRVRDRVPFGCAQNSVMTVGVIGG